MAFGFARARGTSRRYINETNPDLPIGTVLSDRQYRKFLERHGQRVHLPGLDMLRATELKLDALRIELNKRGEALDAREAELNARALALAQAEVEQTQRGFDKLEKGKGRARRYSLLLDLYLEQKSNAGQPMGRQQAMRSTEFKGIVRTIAKTDKHLKNPNADLERKRIRSLAFALVGGAAHFAERYLKAYGRITRRPSQSFGARYQRKTGR